MMQNDVSKQKDKQKWLNKIKKTLTHNLGWKITSLVLAVCLWGGLIAQDATLPRDKVIDGVRVQIINTQALRTSGLVVTGGLDENATVRIRARVPQRYYSTANAANYTARLDLSQIQSTGEQTLKISASSANNSLYGSVAEVYGSEVTVQVEEYAVQTRVPVEVRLTGTAPEGIYPSALTYSPQYVDVGGPKEVVNAAVRCVVEYDQSALSTSRNPNAANLPFVFEDVEGRPLDGTYLTASSIGQTAVLQRIAVNQYAYTMTQVPVGADSIVKGTPASGYRVTGVQVTPTSISIAGRETALAPYLQADAKIFPYEQIDVDGRQQSISTFLALRLPGNMEYVSNSVVQVLVTIEPEGSAALREEAGAP